MTVDVRPDPPVPADLDLRGLKWMPLLGARLFESDFYLRADPLEFRTALLLWWKSWNQVPASSLPNDDALVSKLAGFGEAPAKWRKVRAMALDGFVECRDGRLYHRIVAEQALHAGDWHEQHTEKVANHAERKRRERADRKRMFADLRAVNVVPSYDTGTVRLRELVAEHCKRDDDTQNGRDMSHAVTPGGTANEGTGRDRTLNSGGAVTSPPVPARAHANGGDGDPESPTPPPPRPTPAPPPTDDPPPADPPPPAAPADPPAATPTAAGLACRAIKAGGIVDVNPGSPALHALLDAGVTLETLTATAAELVGRKKPRFALLLSTIEGRMRDAAAAPPLPAASVLNGADQTPPPWQERRSQRMAAAIAPLTRTRPPNGGDDDEGTIDGETRLVG